MVLPGTYEDAEVVGCSLEKGKNSDDPVIRINFLAGVAGESDESIGAWLYTSDAAWPWTEKKLRAMGWDPAANGYDLSPLNREGDQNPLMGVYVRIVVAEKVWEINDGGDGKPRNKVVWIGPPDGGERMAEEEATAFTAALRKRLLASQGRPAAARALKQSAQRSAIPGVPRDLALADDDVPF